jgi:Protein of unknown function (DUF3800)
MTPIGCQKYDKQGKNAVPENDRDYWLKHSEWLEKAVLIQAQFGIRSIIIEGPMRIDLVLRKKDKYLDEILSPAWTPAIPKPLGLDQRFKDMRNLELRAFTWAFPEMLFLIDYELENRGWKAEIVCDHEKVQSRFGLSTVLLEFQKNGTLANVKSVLFEDSKRWTGLQVVDIHAYILRRDAALKAGKIDKPKPTDPRLQTWVPILIKQHSDNELQIIDWGKKIEPVVYEYIIKNCGASAELQQLMWGTVERRLKELSPYL